MPGKRPSVKNEKQYEKLEEKGMSKQRAARNDRAEESSGSQGRSRGRTQVVSEEKISN